MAREARDLLGRGLAQLGIPLAEQAITCLARYSLELLKWNRKVNLVARKTSLEELIEKHFLDSLTLLPVLEDIVPAKGELLDVGSGAGFPGLVVKVARPGRPVSLLEPRLRRVAFLEHIIRLLSLDAITVLPHRTDEKTALRDLHCAVITSRAVADVPSFLEMVDDLADPGARVVCMQGPTGQEHWESARAHPRFDRVGIEHVRLPVSHDHRTLLVFRKRS